MPKNLGSGVSSRLEASEKFYDQVEKEKRDGNLEDFPVLAAASGDEIWEVLEGGRLEFTTSGNGNRRLEVNVDGVNLGYYKLNDEGKEALVLLISSMYSAAIEVASVDTNEQLASLEDEIRSGRKDELGAIEQETAKFLQDHVNIITTSEFDEIWSRNGLTERHVSEIRQARRNARQETSERDRQNTKAEGEVVWNARLAISESQATALQMMSNGFTLNQLRFEQIAQRSNQLLEQAEGPAGWTNEIATQHDALKAELIRALADTYVDTDNLNLARPIFSPDKAEMFDRNAKAIFESFGFDSRGLIFDKITNDRQFQQALKEVMAREIITSGLYDESEIKKTLRDLATTNTEKAIVRNSINQMGELKRKIRRGTATAEEIALSQVLYANTYLALVSDSMTDTELQAVASAIPALEDDVREYVASGRTINPFAKIVEDSYAVGGGVDGNDPDIIADYTQSGVYTRIDNEGNEVRVVNYKEIESTQVLVDAYNHYDAMTGPTGTIDAIDKRYAIGTALINKVFENHNNPSYIKRVFSQLGDGTETEGREKFRDIISVVLMDETSNKQGVINAYHNLKNKNDVFKYGWSDNRIRAEAYMQFLGHLANGGGPRFTPGTPPFDALDFMAKLGVSEVANHVKQAVQPEDWTTPHMFDGSSIDGPNGVIANTGTRLAAYLMENDNPQGARIAYQGFEYLRKGAQYLHTGLWIVGGVRLVKGTWNLGKGLFNVVFSDAKLKDVMDQADKDLLGEKGENGKRKWTTGAALPLASAQTWSALNGHENRVSRAYNNIGAVLGVPMAKEAVRKERARNGIIEEINSVEERIESGIGTLSINDLVNRNIFNASGDYISVNLDSLTDTEKSNMGLTGLTETDIENIENGLARHLSSPDGEYGITSSVLAVLQANYGSSSLNELLDRYKAHANPLSTLQPLLPDGILDNDEIHLLRYQNNLEYNNKMIHLNFIVQQYQKLQGENGLLDQRRSNNDVDSIMPNTGPFSNDQLMGYLSLVKDNSGTSAESWILNTIFPSIADATTVAEVQNQTTAYFKALKLVFSQMVTLQIDPDITNTVVTDVIPYPGREYGSIDQITSSGTESISLFDKTLASYFHSPQYGSVDDVSLPSVGSVSVTGGGVSGDMYINAGQVINSVPALGTIDLTTNTFNESRDIAYANW